MFDGFAVMSGCHCTHPTGGPAIRLKHKKTSALADHVTSAGHSLKWDHFEVLAKGRSDTHCTIKETLLIKDLKLTLNDYVSSEKLRLY